MNPIFKPLYLEMLSSLCFTLSMDLPEESKISNCFWISNDYWKKLLLSPEHLEFQNDDLEIDFYRNVKPKFTSYQQYFILLYESHMFIPPDPLQIPAYWRRESKSLQGFFKEHRSFIRYYLTGKTHKDKEYFLPKRVPIKSILSYSVYDINMDYCSSHDHLVRSYLAHKMFAIFLRQKIKTLIEKPSHNCSRLKDRDLHVHFRTDTTADKYPF